MLLAPGATIILIIFGLLAIRLLGTYGATLGIERKVQKKIAWLVILLLFGITIPLVFTSILHNPFMLWCWICGATTIYIIYSNVTKSKDQQISPSKINKNEELIISIHLNGGNKFKDGETLEVTEGLKIYDSLDDGSKVITDWQDYDFWQITSNKSNRSFEWIREDQNADYGPTLRFWEEGNEHEIRDNVSEDMAIDIILDCNWIQIPGINFVNTNLDATLEKLAMEDEIEEETFDEFLNRGVELLKVMGYTQDFIDDYLEDLKLALEESEDGIEGEDVGIVWPVLEEKKNQWRSRSDQYYTPDYLADNQGPLSEDEKISKYYESWEN